MSSTTHLKCLLVAATLAGASTAATAATVDWTQWTSNTAGTIGSVSVTYGGELSGLQIGYPSWAPATTWTDGTLIGNAPPAANGMINLYGGSTQTNTITFSQPVTNPVFAIWSLGQPGVLASFVFSQTPTFVAGGPNAEYGGLPITVSGNAVTGVEGNGSVVFQGTYSSISWTNPVYEGYYGFTAGINGGSTVIPLPAAAWLLLTGLGALLGVARCRTRAV